MGYGDTLGEIIETAVAQGQAPGVVAAVGRGDETYLKAAGVMAVDGPPMQPDTLFRISSITKPVTAAVVLSLVEDGLLHLDEPVDRLLPELAGRRVLRRPDGPLTDTVAAERPVTARDLLTFTWGFGMQGAMFMAADPWPIVTAVAERELSSFGPPTPDTTPEPDTWMARLGELPLLAQPGERWLSVTEWGYAWDGGSGTSWANVPDQDLTVVVLTQRAVDDTGLPAVCNQVRTAISSS